MKNRLLLRLRLAPTAGSFAILAIGFTLSLILCLTAIPASAIEVIEAWRSPSAMLTVSAAVNPTDGSCWMAATGSGDDTGSRVMHLAADGTVLSEIHGFSKPQCVSVNPTDGSCWAADGGLGQVIHLAEDGTELWRGWGFSYSLSVSVNPADGSCRVADMATREVRHLAEDGTELWRIRVSGRAVMSVSVNPTDGSCWAGDAGYWDEELQRTVATLVHLAEDGAELWRGDPAIGCLELSVNPTDGSCWIASRTTGEVVHLAEDGTELWRGDLYGAASVSVNPTDGSCWVAQRRPCVNAVVHLTADGTELWRGDDFNNPHDVSVNPTDGSCWVAGGQAAHVGEDGTPLWRNEALCGPRNPSVNSADGSCWVGDGAHVIHLAEDGTELWRGAGFCNPSGLSVNPTDGSCWVADWDGAEVVHLAEDGTELWRGGDFVTPSDVSVNSADDSCWVADVGRWEGGADGHYVGLAVVHLAADGTELWRGEGFGWNCSVSVNPTDGSCWVAALGNVGHLAEDGAELWRRGGFGRVWSVSVNPTDGSCWLPEKDNDQVIHLAEDGTELWRGGGFDSSSVSVNPADGSCWVTSSYNGQVVLLAEDGAELWRGGGFSTPGGLSANPTDGSCWVAANGQLVRLLIPGWQPSVFYDVPWYFWAFNEVGACVGAAVVAGYGDGLYHPEYPVTRDQMAVYISRALAGGDENVPDFTGTPTFPDVGDTHWALKYVEYAVSCSVVAGYLDGTYHPEYLVTRDQMAVYVARSICDPTGEDGLADYTPSDPRNFPDVSSGFWSYKHVEYCVENGVVAGYLDGLYHPEILVTRDQMAVYVARAFGLGT